MTAVLLILNTIGCGLIFFTGYCRVVLMDRLTRSDARAAVIFHMVMAAGLAAAPLIPEWRLCLSWPQVLFVLSTAILQIVSSRLWPGRVPKALQNPPDGA